MAYQVVISKGDDVLLTLKVEERKTARAISTATQENDLDCVVTMPAKERIVKFKGID